MAQISRLDDCAMNNMVYIATSIASICVSEVASIVTLSMSHIPIPSRRERFSPATLLSPSITKCKHLCEICAYGILHYVRHQMYLLKTRYPATDVPVCFRKEK